MSGPKAFAHTVVASTRRSWAAWEKRAIVDEARRTTSSISSVARRHGITPSLLFRWRRERLQQEQSAERPPDPRPLSRLCCLLPLRRFCQGSRHCPWPTRTRVDIGLPLTKEADEDAVLGMRIGGRDGAIGAHLPGLSPVPLPGLRQAVQRAQQR